MLVLLLPTSLLPLLQCWLPSNTSSCQRPKIPRTSPLVAFRFKQLFHCMKRRERQEQFPVFPLYFTVGFRSIYAITFSLGFERIHFFNQSWGPSWKRSWWKGIVQDSWSKIRTHFYARRKGGLYAHGIISPISWNNWYYRLSEIPSLHVEVFLH